MMAFFVCRIVLYMTRKNKISQSAPSLWYIVNSVVELIFEKFLYLRSDFASNWEVIQILTQSPQVRFQRLMRVQSSIDSAEGSGEERGESPLEGQCEVYGQILQLLPGKLSFVLFKCEAQVQERG